MNYSQLYRPKPAERLTEPIFETGLSQHHFIYLSADAHGVERISENYKSQEVRLIRAKAYLRYGRRFRVYKFSGSERQWEAAAHRALSQVDAPNNLIKFNCEHYAELVQTAKSVSKQKEWMESRLAFALLVHLVRSLTYVIANTNKSI